MDFERAPAPPAALPTAPVPDGACEVIELRRYALHAGQRDTLIDLFDREFVETQEAHGMSVMGQFRDLDAAERFVWLRGFADMDARPKGLGAFYGGPVWAQHRDAANATMAAFDDVLLLRPAWAGAGVSMAGRERAAGIVRTALPGLLDLSVVPLREAAPAELLRFCREVMTPCLQRAGAQVLGWYVTESRPNNFAQLPVREGEWFLVGLALFASEAAHQAFVAGGAWAREVAPTLAGWLCGPVQAHRLVATARSAIHL
ncbi:MAG: NIPSNAP family protein [Hydrogenophaga sp.]|nr:NIPSNAP family protein [Hydrogenophaga sp.]